MADEPSGISDIVHYLELLWGVIGSHHPDLPPAVIVVASGEEGVRLSKWGHWGATCWKRTADGSRVGEVLIAGEALASGPEQVLGTLVHEAAHALATARKLKDTSRQGRYHNQVYKELAEEVGLVVQKTLHGWNQTKLGELARDRYAPIFPALEAKLYLVRPSLTRRQAEGEEEGEGEEGGGEEGEGEGSSTKRPALSCECDPPRLIRVAPKVAGLGPIACGICLREFQVVPEGEERPDPGRVWTVEDQQLDEEDEEDDPSS